MSTSTPEPLENMSKPGKIEGTSSVGLYGRLLTYLKPLKLALVVSILGYIVYAACSTAVFGLLQEMIDLLGGEQISPQTRLMYPLIVLALVLGRGVGGYFGSYSMAYVANHVLHKIRCEIVERFLTLPVSFYDRRTGGHLMSLVTFNVSQISTSISDALTVILREGLWVIAIVGFMLYTNWKLTLIFMTAGPFISIVIRYASKKFRKHNDRIQISMGDVTHILSETIKGFKIIRTFGAEPQVQKNFKVSSELNLKQNLKIASVASISTPVIQFVMAMALAMLIWLVSSPEAMSGVSAGGFVSYIAAAVALLQPVRKLSKVNVSIQRGLSAAQTVFDLLDETNEKDTGKYETAQVKGKVEFKDVSFSYDTTQLASGEDKAEEGSPLFKRVLNDINFTCEAGKTIAFVGKSGSGKTTLVNLIPRFYELDQGQICIDDIPISDFTLKNLREQISLVSQQVVLFNGSIRDNIAYGSLADKSNEEIIQALKNANAMEFIESLPEGIDTMVGDDATLLSGGQRQRLAIARALLKDAPILILDEATSALDSVSERYIQSALETLMAGRTTFVIAHRLSTIEKADQIMVMSEGKIVESGSHQELLALEQHYSRLHKMQFSEL